MENAKKMILIEPEVLSRTKRSALEVSSTPLSSLDNDMENVFKLKKDDREKWVLSVVCLPIEARKPSLPNKY